MKKLLNKLKWLLKVPDKRDDTNIEFRFGKFVLVNKRYKRTHYDAQ